MNSSCAWVAIRSGQVEPCQLASGDRVLTTSPSGNSSKKAPSSSLYLESFLLSFPFILISTLTLTKHRAGKLSILWWKILSEKVPLCLRPLADDVCNACSCSAVGVIYRSSWLRVSGLQLRLIFSTHPLFNHLLLMVLLSQTVFCWQLNQLLLLE